MEKKEENILGVHQLLIIPFSEDGSQFGTIFKLSHPAQVEVLSRGNKFTSQINNLKGNCHINVSNIITVTQIDVAVFNILPM